MNPQVYNPQGFGTTRQGGISPSHEGPGGVGFRGFFPQVQPPMSPNNPFSMIAPPMPSPNYNLGYTPPSTPLPPPVAPVPTDTTGNAYWDQSGGNKPVNWGDDRSVSDPTQTSTPPGQYPPERIAQHAQGDSLYNAAFDSSEAAYLAQNPAMSPQLATKLFPQNVPNLDQSIGGLMARTNELGSETVPRELPGMGTDTGGMYNAPSTEGNVSYQGDPANLALPPSTGQGTSAAFQQMTNPLGGDFSSSVGPTVSDEVQPPPMQGPPAVYDPQAEALALATQYMAGKEPTQKTTSYWGGGFGNRPDISMNPNATSMNQMGLEGPVPGLPRADMESLVSQPPGTAMSAEDAAELLAVSQPKKDILPEVATPTTTGTGKTGDSSVITPPVVEPEVEVEPKVEVKPGEVSTKPPTAKVTDTKKPSGEGLGTAIGTSTPSGATTGPNASSGGINIAGIYDDASKGKGIAGTSDIDYTNIPAPDPNIDYSKVDPRTGEPDKWTKFGDLMTSPRMRVAMMQAAKALDPTGFGGKLATGMEPIMTGEFENDYMSRVLAGEDPGKVGKDYAGVLSMDQMNSARDEVIKIAEQQRKQQATDETEDPIQKFYREMTGTAYKGQISLDVADKNYFGKIHSAIASSGSANNKQITTQAFKQLNDIADKLPVGVYTKDADGNIVMDEAKWSKFLLSDHKPVTPTEINSFIGAIEQLIEMNVPTMGFENSLEDMKKLRDNLNPTELTQVEFKEGDIKEMGGKKYKRDAKGEWRPVV
jgi:hypothetical protein